MVEEDRIPKAYREIANSPDPHDNDEDLRLPYRGGSYERERDEALEPVVNGGDDVDLRRPPSRYRSPPRRSRESSSRPRTPPQRFDMEEGGYDDARRQRRWSEERYDGDYDYRDRRREDFGLSRAISRG